MVTLVTSFPLCVQLNVRIVEKCFNMYVFDIAIQMQTIIKYNIYQYFHVQKKALRMENKTLRVKIFFLQHDMICRCQRKLWK